MSYARALGERSLATFQVAITILDIDTSDHLCADFRSEHLLHRQLGSFGSDNPTHKSLDRLPYCL